MVSTRLNGRGQYLGRADTFSLGIADIWTIGFWSKPFANKEHAAIFSTASKNGKNEISITTTPVSETDVLRGSPPAELRVVVKDADGTTIKHYGWGNFFQDGIWTHTFLQWNGVDLDAFRDGVATTTGVALVNVTGTMSDFPDRRLFYGSAVGGTTATFSGILGHFGVWDSILAPAEMGTVVSGGFGMDLTVASGSYVSTGSFQHYWKPGQNYLNIGEDFAGSLDLNKLHTVTSGNITLDAP